MKRLVLVGAIAYRVVQQYNSGEKPTVMDLGISIFLIFVRCVALRNLDMLIETGWSVYFVRFVAENAGRG